ncbi:SusC/RagA family TonB-linked outer membrane protein [Gaoshiqia sp. Z1-71]|uniref:SusC/RagA family TonB-linked outer membrane protein n=1 Tax=Gaoshiqia hydrogeniformans TaxID=3290090 RepID=UPI003BF8AA1B
MNKFMKKSSNCAHFFHRKDDWTHFIRVMNSTVLIILLGISTVFAGSTYSQNTRLSLHLKNATIRKVFEEIQKQSEFIIFYKDSHVNLEQEINVSADQFTVDKILSQVLEGTNLTYQVVDRQIVIIPVSDSPSDTKDVILQPGEKNIAGIVKDVNGDPVPGATVFVKGTTNGTISDVDGKFSLNRVTNESVLIISFIGMRTQEIKIGNRLTFNLVMEAESFGVDEVIVVGYTAQRKATITGSIATITTKDLKQSPTANLTNALAGRMPGLLVNQFSGGEPGVDRSDIYVRGFGTYGDKSPIVIVDGVERSMNYLAPEEIETFTILKDASATAPYGVRGANGVIIITTKRGVSQEKASVNFKASIGTNQPVKFPTYLGSADYAELYNEAIRNDNQGIDESTLNLFTQSAIDDFRRAKGDNSDGLGYNWDYFDYAFKPGVQTDYSLSIRGGSDRARYYVMANYFQQDGNYKHTNLGQYDTQAIFKRYNFRSNIDIDITDNFYARLDIGARITDRNAPGTTAARIVEFANTQPSYLPIVVEPNDHPANKTYIANNPSGMLFGDQIYRFNILGELSRTGFLNEKNSYLDGSFSLGHKLDFITRGLKVEGVFSYDASEGRWINRRVDTYSEGYREYPGYATFVPLDGSDVYRTPGYYTGAYKTGNKYNIDQTIGNSITRNSTVGRTYYQVKLEYARKFGRHDVGGLVLGNRSKRDVDNAVAYCYQGD